MFDAVKVKDKCVLWIRDFFERNGKGCNAVVGISGGKDSSVVAALCVEALGRERVIGVLMPQGVQPDIEAAYLLVNHLGIKHYEVNIKNAVDDVLKSISALPEISRQTRVNLPARIRWQLCMLYRRALMAEWQTPVICPRIMWDMPQGTETAQVISVLFVI